MGWVWDGVWDGDWGGVRDGVRFHRPSTSRSAAMSIASACFSPSCDRSVTSSSNPQMVFRDVCCLKTEVITDATSSPISLPSSETWVKVELVLRAYSALGAGERE